MVLDPKKKEQREDGRGIYIDVLNVSESIREKWVSNDAGDGRNPVCPKIMCIRSQKRTGRLKSKKLHPVRQDVVAIHTA